MKKIIIIIIILLISGCYDLVELDNLRIVTSIGIDYKDDNYIVTYEVLNDYINEDENVKSFTVTGAGNTITKAFESTNYKITKKPLFSHLELLVLSDNIINDNLDNIIDYLIRNKDIRDEFYIVISKDITPEELLNKSNDKYLIISNEIIKLLKNTRYNNDLFIDNNYQEIISKILSNKEDIIINGISYDNELIISNSYIFNKYKYINILNEFNTSLYKMLLNKSSNTIFEYINNNKVLSISISNTFNKIDIDNECIYIDLLLKTRILENNINYDLNNLEDYNKVVNIFKDIINNNVYDLIRYLQLNNSDILGLQNIYYRKYSKDINNLWNTLDIKINTKIEINDKGFVNNE